MAGGLELAGFEQVEQIGHGGYGVVYRAFQPAFRRTVAIKVLTGAGTGGAALDVLQREAAAMGSLSGHPNIVTVHEAGLTDEGLPYLVMPFLAGGSLADRLDVGPVPWGAAVSTAVKVAGALATAHAEGVLHRDVKPDNILFSAFDEPLLADFGIARVAWTTETEHDGVKATVLYAPPEVLGGSRPTAASDVYSLAAATYAAVTGAPAFFSPDDDSLTPLIARIATAAPPEPPADVLPPAVWAVLVRALAKDPGDRPGSAARFGRGLQQAQRGLGLEVTPITLPPSIGVEEDDETDLFEDPQVEVRRETVQIGEGRARALTTKLVLHQPTPPGATPARPSPAHEVPAARRRRRRWALVGLGALVLVAFAVGAALLAGRDGGGEPTEQASEVAATTVDPADPASPSAGSLPRPTWRSVVPRGEGRALLSWDDDADDEAGYAIQQGDEVIEVVPPGSTEVEVAGLAPDRRVCFLVGAVAEDADTSWTSAPSCVSTTAPAAPTDVVLRDLGGGTAEVTWSDPGRNARDFVIELDGQPYTTAAVSERSVQITDLPDGVEACVVVVARNEVRSTPSDEVCEPIS